MGYDEAESGQVSEEEFNELFRKKKEAKPVNPIKRIFGKKEEQDEYGELAQEESDAMDASEREAEHQRLIEYSERPQPVPETEEENVGKLLVTDARLSKRKELVEVVHPQLKAVRKVPIESSDRHPEMFVDDIVKSNLTDEEIRATEGHMRLVNYYRLLSDVYGFPFVQLEEFHDAQKNIMLNLSRGRAGFSVKMSRMRRTETEGMIQHLKLSEALKQKNKFKFLR